MANRYSVASGLASAPSTWDGGATVPVSGDRVLISAGHTVTLNGAFEWGDDSAATVVVNGVSTTASIFVVGTLAASQSVSSQLTCNGQIMIVDNGGSYAAGTVASPLPLGINHTLVLNKSSVLAANKYNMQVHSSLNYQGKLSLHGFFRRRNTVLIGAVAVNATSAIVADASGWRIGDAIIFAPTDSHSAVDERTILTITPGSGTTATVTFAALTFAHMNDSPVGNFTSNVIVKPFDATAAGRSSVSLISAYTVGGNTGYLHVQNVRLEGCGGDSTSNASRFGMLNIYPNNVIAGANPFDEFSSLAFYCFGSYTSPNTTSQLNLLNARSRIQARDLAFFSQLGNVHSVTEYSGCVIDWFDSAVYRTGSTGVLTGYSQGGVGCTHKRMKFFGVSGYGVSASTSFSSLYEDCIFGPSGTYNMVAAVSVSDFKFVRCDFGFTFGAGFATRSVDFSSSVASGVVTFEDCKFHPSILDRPVYMKQTSPTAKIVSTNRNTDVTSHQIHKASGSIWRDDVMKTRSVSSIKMVPDQPIPVVFPVTQEIKFQAKSGVPQKVIGYLRRDATYGALTQPFVTLSGGGIAPVTYTMTGGGDQWERFELTAVQNGAPVETMTLTVSGQSIQNNGSCWLSGIPLSPFVESVRHYGYLFDESSVTRTVNPITVATEAQALAYTGVAVDVVAKKITITAGTANTFSAVYDYLQAWSCLNVDKEVPLTSADGVNFASGYDLTIDGCNVDGVINLSMPSRTLTVLNGGSSAATITHNAGTITRVSVDGLVAGSRLQVFDITNGVELYNGVPSGAFSMNKNWQSDLQIRLRATSCVGLTAFLPWSQVGVFKKGGLSILASQTIDGVYATNAIDGSTVTEYSADYASVQIDISDGDGVTTPQRGYAWFCHITTTAVGIANYFGAFSADDTANYCLHSEIINIKIQNASALPTVLSGARVYRTDGASIFAPGAGAIQADAGKVYVEKLGVPALSSDERAKIMQIQPASDLANSVWSHSFVQKLLTVGKFIGLK
jgi:hypothetical protein